MSTERNYVATALLACDFEDDDDDEDVENTIKAISE